MTTKKTTKRANPKEKQVEIGEAVITLPVLDEQAKGYEAQQIRAGILNLGRTGLHVNAQLGPELAAVFVKIRQGLRATNAKHSGDVPVYSNVDTLKWILEQVGEVLA